jgi:hypothetical protein
MQPILIDVTQRFAAMDDRTLLGSSTLLSTILIRIAHFWYIYVGNDRLIYFAVIPSVLAIIMGLFQMSYLQLYTCLPTGSLAIAVLIGLKRWHWIASGGAFMGLITDVYYGIAEHSAFSIPLYALCVPCMLVALVEYHILDAVLTRSKQQQPGPVLLTSDTQAVTEPGLVSLPPDVAMASSESRSDQVILTTSIVLSMILISQAWLSNPRDLVIAVPSGITILLCICQMVYRYFHPHMYPGLPHLVLLVFIKGWHWALSGGLTLWILWGSLKTIKTARLEEWTTKMAIFVILWSTLITMVVLSEYRVLDTLLVRTRQQRQLLLMGHDAEQEQGHIFLPADRDSDVETELSV